MRADIAANCLYFPVTRLAGERIRHYLAEYRAHDRFAAAALVDLQTSALRRLVDHARRNTRYYAAAFADRSGLHPSSIPELNGLAPVGKALLRERAAEFVATGSPGRHESKTTSGSTGHPLTILKGRDALARERAATWRAYGWAGIPVAAPYGLLWGLPHSSSGRARARLLDFLANRKRLSMFGVTDSDFAGFHRKLIDFQPHYLYGYVSALKAFSQFLQASGRTLPRSVRCIVSTSEILDEGSRHLISEATGLRVFNEYGCGEVGSIAHECEAGRLHVMSDNLVLECLPYEGLPDGLGELVVTDLHNTVMPLIRYRLGDLGRMAQAPCECGKPYPVVDQIVGRAYDIIVGRSGRRYHPESILYVFEDLRRAGRTLPPFQAVQERDGAILFRFQADPGMLTTIADVVSKAMTAAFQDELIMGFESVDQLVREPSGKLRVVKRIVASDGASAPGRHD